MTPAKGYTEMKDSGIEWLGENSQRIGACHSGEVHAFKIITVKKSPR